MRIIAQDQDDRDESALLAQRLPYSSAFSEQTLGRTLSDEIDMLCARGHKYTRAHNTIERAYIYGAGS